jgi:hypothetical protein
MDAALAHLRKVGTAAAPEDVVRLWPLEHKHVNFLGKYSFAGQRQLFLPGGE